MESSSPSSSPISNNNDIEHRVFCDNCFKETKKQENIIGKRWKCNFCPNYNLCDACLKKKQQIHEPSHTFRQVKIIALDTEDWYKSFIVDIDEEYLTIFDEDFSIKAVKNQLKKFSESGEFQNICTFLGATRAGKSSIIKLLIKHSKSSILSPQIPSRQDTMTPTSANIQTFSINLGGRNLLLLDGEGIEPPQLPPSTLTTREKEYMKNYPEGSEKWLKERRNAVQNLIPKFAYLSSNIIVYVTRHHISVGEFKPYLKNLVEACTDGVESSLFPSLLIIFNQQKFDKDEYKYFDMNVFTEYFFTLQGCDDIFRNKFLSIKCLAIPHYHHPCYENIVSQLDQLKNYLEKELETHQKLQKSIFGEAITLSQWSTLVPHVLGEIIVGKPIRMGSLFKTRSEDLKQGLSNSLYRFIFTPSIEKSILAKIAFKVMSLFKISDENLQALLFKETVDLTECSICGVEAIFHQLIDTHAFCQPFSFSTMQKDIEAWKKSLAPLSSFSKAQIPAMLNLIERALIGDYLDIDIGYSERFENCLFCNLKKQTNAKTCKCSKKVCEDCFDTIAFKSLPESKKADNFKCIVCLMNELFGKELEDLFPRNGKPSEYCFLVADLNKTSLLVLINETILSMSLE